MVTSIDHSLMAFTHCSQASLAVRWRHSCAAGSTCWLTSTGALTFAWPAASRPGCRHRCCLHRPRCPRSPTRTRQALPSAAGGAQPQSTSARSRAARCCCLVRPTGLPPGQQRLRQVRVTAATRHAPAAALSPEPTLLADGLAAACFWARLARGVSASLPLSDSSALLSSLAAQWQQQLSLTCRISWASRHRAGVQQPCVRSCRKQAAPAGRFLGVGLACDRGLAAALGLAAGRLLAWGVSEGALGRAAAFFLGLGAGLPVSSWLRLRLDGPGDLWERRGLCLGGHSSATCGPEWGQLD